MFRHVESVELRSDRLSKEVEECRKAAMAREEDKLQGARALGVWVQVKTLSRSSGEAATPRVLLRAAVDQVNRTATAYSE